MNMDIKCTVDGDVITWSYEGISVSVDFNKCLNAERNDAEIDEEIARLCD